MTMQQQGQERNAADLHIPVLMKETLAALQPVLDAGRDRPVRILDGTLGMAGHSSAMLQAAPQAELCALDRDEEALELARRRLEPFGGRVHIYHCRYSQFEEALDDLGWDKVDAVLLDIETPGIDGMAFARRLRACNSRIDIIFVTCHTDLVMDGFSVHAAGFLPKPVEQKQLWETLDFLAKRSISRRADACVTFKRGTACDRYYYDDILYIEARLHNIVVVTPQTRQKYNLSLTQALENLPQPPFVRCHRSYIVNTTKVTAVEKDALLLAGGGKAPTTPTYSTAIQRALLALKA